jgi:hypothetical protein
MVGEGVFHAQDPDIDLVLLPAQGQGWTINVGQESWSPAYGRKAPTTSLTFSATVELPAEFAFLLIAGQNAARNRTSFQRIKLASSTAVSTYEYVASGCEYSFFFNDCGRPWRTGGLVSDAMYVCHTRKTMTSEEQLILCEGSYARVEGGAELRCSRQVAWAELDLEENGRRTFASDASAVVHQSVPEPVLDPVSAISGKP